MGWQILDAVLMRVGEASHFIGFGPGRTRAAQGVGRTVGTVELGDGRVRRSARRPTGRRRSRPVQARITRLQVATGRLRDVARCAIGGADGEPVRPGRVQDHRQHRRPQVPGPGGKRLDGADRASQRRIARLLAVTTCCAIASSGKRLQGVVSTRGPKRAAWARSRRQQRGHRHFLIEYPA
ncbi:hypothetical protein ACRAWF_29860 [Streptomyces sp. L7]